MTTRLPCFRCCGLYSDCVRSKCRVGRVFEAHHVKRSFGGPRRLGPHYGWILMYKVLLCWRYLLTRYLALACVVSVMLGVATLIVVNSVMGGFSTKLKDRLHGLLSDVLIESISFSGFDNPDEKMKRIWESSIGDKIETMTPAIEIFAMLQFQCHGELVTRPVRLIGVEPKGRAQISGFAEYLVNQDGTRAAP